MDVELATTPEEVKHFREAPFGLLDTLLRASPQLRNCSLWRCQVEAVLAVDGLWHARQTLGVMSP